MTLHSPSPGGWPPRTGCLRPWLYRNAQLFKLVRLPKVCLNAPRSYAVANPPLLSADVATVPFALGTGTASLTPEMLDSRHAHTRALSAQCLYMGGTSAGCTGVFALPCEMHPCLYQPGPIYSKPKVAQVSYLRHACAHPRVFVFCGPFS